MTAPVTTNTPISYTAAYCTAQQFVDRVDVRSAGQLLSDNTVALTNSQVLASGVLASLLQEASGEVEAACFKSDRYTPGDLVSLAGASPVTNSALMLAGIVAGLALAKLFGRRPERAPEKMPRLVTWAEKQLARLAAGELVLGYQEHADAGVLSDHVETATDVELRNGAAVQARDYFGRRSNRYGCD